MLVHNESTARRDRARIRINWSRELAFSLRQIGYIGEYVPDERGIYCIYAKNYLFDYSSPLWPTKRWNSVVYVGSGWIRQRLIHHLTRRKNDVLSEFIDNYDLAYRYERVFDDDEQDWPRIAEALLLSLFTEKFDDLPPANRRQESIPYLGLHILDIDESDNFSVLARGK
jgi:hypothetical protein